MQALDLVPLRSFRVILWLVNVLAGALRVAVVGWCHQPVVVLDLIAELDQQEATALLVVLVAHVGDVGGDVLAFEVLLFSAKMSYKVGFYFSRMSSRSIRSCFIMTV